MHNKIGVNSGNSFNNSLHNTNCSLPTRVNRFCISIKSAFENNLILERQFGISPRSELKRLAYNASELIIFVSSFERKIKIFGCNLID